MSLILPTHIYSFGDYYSRRSLRFFVHRLKEGDVSTMYDIAPYLAVKLPKNAVLVPVPSQSGYTETFTRILGALNGVGVSECLQRREGVESLYERKKRGERVSESDTGIFLARNAPSGRLILVDNVIATGTTVSACIRALKAPCEAACIAVDYATLINSTKEYREKYTY